MENTGRNNDVAFISVEAFKQRVGATKLEVKHNKTTGKNFVVDEKGNTWKAQGTFDSKKAFQFIYERDDEKLENACLINYDDSKGAETIASF